MNIKDLVEEAGYHPKRKAACHGGEYFSPCPFCKDGNDRFLIWPNREDENGEYNCGRFRCRVCDKKGNAINFLWLLYGMKYKDAFDHLKIAPKQRLTYTPREKPNAKVVEEPAKLWKNKAKAFAEWSHKQLLDNDESLLLLRKRGFTDDSIVRFGLGFNPESFFRDRQFWGLAPELKEDGKERKLWLPSGIVIPTLSDGNVVKVKIRRSNWTESDKYPKYVEVSGSKQSPSIFGDCSLSVALILESELDALLIQQETADLVFCVALGGSTKSIDSLTDSLLKKIQTLLFVPDFDEAGAKAWSRWKKMFPSLHRLLTPEGKAPGDDFVEGLDIREWINLKLEEIKCKK